MEAMQTEEHTACISQWAHHIHFLSNDAVMEIYCHHHYAQMEHSFIHSHIYSFIQIFDTDFIIMWNFIIQPKHFSCVKYYCFCILT